MAEKVGFFRRFGRGIKNFISKTNKRVRRNFKALGKLGTAICFIIAIAITFAPSIYFGIAHLIGVDPHGVWKATGWVAFIFAPAGGTGTVIFLLSLITTTSVGVWIMNKKVEDDDEEEIVKDSKETKIDVKKRNNKTV